MKRHIKRNAHRAVSLVHGMFDRPGLATPATLLARTLSRITQHDTLSILERSAQRVKTERGRQNVQNRWLNEAVCLSRKSPVCAVNGAVAGSHIETLKRPALQFIELQTPHAISRMDPSTAEKWLAGHLYHDAMGAKGPVESFMIRMWQDTHSRVAQADPEVGRQRAGWLADFARRYNPDSPIVGIAEARM